MPIADLCTSKFITVEQGSTLQQAAQMMKKHHTGGVIIIEANSKAKPVGILTDRDIVLSAVAENRPLTSKVEDIMSKKIVKVEQHEGIASVIHKMQQEGVRKMIVVDKIGNACGLVSSDDLLQLVGQELSDLGSLVSRQIAKEKGPKAAQKTQ